MLKQLDITNLKSISKTSLKLAPLTILAGANSAGKSTVMQALMLLIKHSGSSNRFSMEELLRYMNDFSAIRNKRTNARSLNITAIDHQDKTHQININADGTEADSQLQYVYEPPTKIAEQELLYLNANRIGAQELVPVADRKIGLLGEFVFPTFDKVKGNILPDELLKFEGSKTISYQLSQWLAFITGTSLELQTEKTSDQVKVSFNVKDIDSQVSPYNLGAGMSDVAKVLIVCLMAKKGDLILIENPEVQLHPKAQALLGVFLAFIASSGIQLIIETHCEHLINKVAYQVYEDEIESEDVVIHYKGHVEEDFQAITIDLNGEFNDPEGNIISFPAGFFDVTLTDLMDMR